MGQTHLLQDVIANPVKMHVHAAQPRLLGNLDQGRQSGTVDPRHITHVDVKRCAAVAQTAKQVTPRLGHGPPVQDPKARTDWMIVHRRKRECEILDALGKSPSNIPDLTRNIYYDTPARLLPAAQRNVFAHLIDLHINNRVSAKPNLSFEAQFFRL